MGLALTAPPARAQLADSLWPMFQHDPQHTGRGEVAGPQGPSPQLVWDFRPRSRARASVSVGEAAPGLDGDVYVGDGRNPLSAVDAATGEQIWFSTKRQGAIPDRSQPAVSADGSIFVGARDNDLWKIGADGSVLCRFHVTHDGDVTTSPTIARDGTVYMGSGALGGAWFYSMRPDCDGSTMIPNWLNKLGGSLENMSPALNHAEDVVFVSLKTEAVALHASDGSEKWRVPLARKGFGRTSNFSPSVANDGSAVYFNSKDGLYALDPETGATSWNFVPPHPDGAKQKEEIHVSPAIGGDGTLYFGASKGKKSSHFYALNPDGTIKWSRELFDKGQFRGTQAVIGVDAAGDDDLIYVGHGRFLLALEADTGAVRWTMFIPGRIESGPVLGAPGVLYLGVGAHLYKISD